MQDSIIVYRNPLEKAMWEGLMNGPTLLSIVVFVVVAVIMSWIFLTLCNKMFTRNSNARNISYLVSICISCVIAFFACSWVYTHII